jgi:hypothetical protein
MRVFLKFFRKKFPETATAPRVVIGVPMRRSVLFALLRNDVMSVPMKGHGTNRSLPWIIFNIFSIFFLLKGVRCIAFVVALQQLYVGGFNMLSMWLC